MPCLGVPFALSFVSVSWRRRLTRSVLGGQKKELSALSFSFMHFFADLVYTAVFFTSGRSARGLFALLFFSSACG